MSHQCIMISQRRTNADSPLNKRLSDVVRVSEHQHVINLVECDSLMVNNRPFGSRGRDAEQKRLVIWTNWATDDNAGHGRSRLADFRALSNISDAGLNISCDVLFSIESACVAYKGYIPGTSRTDSWNWTQSMCVQRPQSTCWIDLFLHSLQHITQWHLIRFRVVEVAIMLMSKSDRYSLVLFI